METNQIDPAKFPILGVSPWAPFFRAAARVKRIRGVIIRKICHLEGGQMWSQTYRELMHSYYGIEIGMYSYGPVLSPGLLPEGTRIGRYCSLAAGIEVFRRNHPIDRISQHPFFYNSSLGLLHVDSININRDNPLTVESDVWIGTNAIITSGCHTIGLGAIIAAGAVVTKDVLPFAVMAGVPARQIRDRFPAEVKKTLLESRWWEHPINRLVPFLPRFLSKASPESVLFLKQHLRSPDFQR